MIKPIKLSKRLTAIAGYIEKGSDVADIGTDHGYLPVYLAQNGLVRRIIASDISEESLEAAKRSAAKYGFANKITFINAPGLAGISEHEVDTIVMSGMGGETISGILAEAPWTKHPRVRIIMQPQTKLDIICLWLRDSGYVIQDAELVRDRGRFYVVMLVSAAAQAPAALAQGSEGAPAAQGSGVRGQGSENTLVAQGSGDANAGFGAVSSMSSLPYTRLTEIELFSILAGKGDPFFAEYIDKLISKTRRAVEGMAKAGAAGYADMTQRFAALSNLKETL